MLCNNSQEKQKSITSSIKNLEIKISHFQKEI